jgi:prophage regulatory protein
MLAPPSDVRSNRSFGQATDEVMATHRRMLAASFWRKVIATAQPEDAYSLLMPSRETPMPSAMQPADSVKHDFAAEPHFPFLRIRAVTRMTGLGRSTIYRLMAAKQFPAPVRLAQRAVAWRQTDLERWSAARPAAQ